MPKESIEDMRAAIKDKYSIADAKNITMAAKIRALRDARKTQLKIYELEMAALKEQSVGKPNAAYMIPEEKIKEVVDCMVRFGFLRKAK
jgi:hypothetical protein